MKAHAAPSRVGDSVIQRKPIPAARQPNLEIGSFDDPLEHEADRVADEVMGMSDHKFSLTSASGQVCRKCCADCEEEDKRKLLQAKPAGTLANEAPASVYQTVGSPGEPLDLTTREFFEPRFRHDFSDVRIHADSAASSSARRINALGYTVGRHVVFADGHYSPETTGGRRLLAHELAHVMQQSPSTIRRRPNPRHPWNSNWISAGIVMSDAQGGFVCSVHMDPSGNSQACGQFPGERGPKYDCVDGATYASVCPSPCVGQPLHLEPSFYVDGTPWPERPQPFDPPNLSAVVMFYPDAGDPDVVTRETSTGKYVAPGHRLDTGFGDLTFFTPDSTGTLMVSVGIADPSSGAVAIYSESIPVVDCPTSEPEPDVAEPEIVEEPAKPVNGRQTRFNIEVRDPINAPLVYQLVDKNTPLEGPGGLFPVWQDQMGGYYYLNNGRRVDLPNFSPP